MSGVRLEKELWSKSPFQLRRNPNEHDAYLSTIGHGKPIFVSGICCFGFANFNNLSYFNGTILDIVINLLCHNRPALRYGADKNRMGNGKDKKQ